MLLKVLNNDKGMALLITLGVITIMIAGALEINRRVRASVVATASSRDRFTLIQMAASGVQAAMLMLNKDKKESSIDSIQEDWANPGKIGEALMAIPFEKGNTTIAIRDELGKIQINALVDFPKGRHYNESQKIMWDRLVRLMTAQDEELFKDVEAPVIINSIKDWLDSGDDDATTGLSGAEAEYYEGLDPPYKPNNGPFIHIDELRQVKGITPELFGGLKEMTGLHNYITIYGMTKSSATVENRNFTFDGKININTADLPVLMALVPSENPDYAQAIFDYRNEQEEGEFINDLSSTTWYKNVPDIPGDFTIDPKLIRISSDFFHITSTATLNKMQLTIKTVVHREQTPKTGKWMCRILSWQTE